MKSDILFIYLVLCFFLCCQKKNSLSSEIIPANYEIKFYKDQLIVKANRFVQGSRMPAGYVMQSDISLVVFQVIEKKPPVDSLEIEKEIIFPYAVDFYNYVLKDEVRKNNLLLSGTVLFRIQVYDGIQFISNLEFKYPTLYLSQFGS